MILEIEQIAKLIDTPKNKAAIAKAGTYAKELSAYLNGGDDLNVEKIDSFEDETLFRLRKKYGRSTKDLFARITRPVDKVFSARGGTTYYRLSDEAEKKARSITGNVTAGISVKTWVRNHWRAHYLDDPNGFVLITLLDKAELSVALMEGRAAAKPVYVPISAVHDYDVTGTRVEYLIFKLTPDDKKSLKLRPEDEYYRVIDDANDTIFRVNSENTIFTEDVMPNYFGYVPAVQCSDIPHASDPVLKLSFVDPVVELGKQALVNTSIKATHSFLHGFPKYWEYSDSCHACGATGLVDGGECKTCKGTGRSAMTKVSDVKLITPPSSKDDPIIAPNVAGYVSPDKVFFEIATQEIANLEQTMYATLWGTSDRTQVTTGAQNTGDGVKTATQVMDDTKPIADRLEQISAQAERVDKFITDAVIRISLTLPAYEGALVNYGRRYMLESADVLWTKYADAKAKKAPISALDDLYLEYVESKFSSDPVKQSVMLKLMKVEPFFHLTASEVLALNIGEAEYKAKVYFGEWLSSLPDNEVLLKSVTDLQASLATYVESKSLKPEPAPIKPV